MVESVKPLCPVFGTCGGCAYQDIPYEEEIKLKAEALKDLFKIELGIGEELFDPVLPSPKPYHYRHRLDLSLIKTKREGIFIGFRHEGNRQVVDIESCAIAQEEVSTFIPELRKQALEKLPEKYRMATLTVTTGNEGRVVWGGIGRRSLRQEASDYLWTEIYNRKIFYSLETFFQANLAILPQVVDKIRSLPIWDKETHFFDLYGGVGLFGLSVSDLVKKVFIVESAKPSAEIAQYNVEKNQLDSVDVHVGEVEKVYPYLLKGAEGDKKIAMVDPPRRGLSDPAREALIQSREVKALLYLSCQPETLVRDLLEFIKKDWRVVRVFPFDFFPKTKHLETLVWLEPKDTES